MKLTSIAGFLALAVSTACSQAHRDTRVNVFHNSGNHVKGESREFTKVVNGKEVRLFLIDMMHVAPKSYYDNVRNLIREKSNNKKSVIAAEGFYCESATGNDIVYSVDNPSAFSKNAFPDASLVDDPAMMAWMELPKEQRTADKLMELSREAKDHPERFAKYSEKNTVAALKTSYANLDYDAIKSIVGTGFLRKDTCKTFNERRSLNSTYEKLAKQFNLAMQSSVESLYGKVPVAKADLNMISLPAGERMLFGAYVSCLGNEACVTGQGGFLSWASGKESSKGSKAAHELIEEIVLQRRNSVLVQSINSLSEQGHDAIFAPWGERHMTGLYQLLAANGFTEDKSQSLEFASCSSVRDNALLSQLEDFVKLCR